MSERTGARYNGVKIPEKRPEQPRAGGRKPGSWRVKSKPDPTYLLKQCAAVTTQRLVSREPAQWCEPFLKMLTTQGHSASALSSPPTTRFSC